MIQHDPGGTTTVVANVYADGDLEGSYRQASETIAEVRWRLARALPMPIQSDARAAPQFVSNMPREGFEAMVEWVDLVPLPRVSALQAD